MARFTRPDKTVRTYWREEIDEAALKDPGLELVLPDKATIESLDHRLIRPDGLPALWQSDEIGVAHVVAYFAGGKVVKVPREGYEEEIVIPACAETTVMAAVQEAVEKGQLWLLSGPATLLG